MKKKQRLIIVSNRLPHQFNEKKGRVAMNPSAGGLVSSIQSYIEHLKGQNKNGLDVVPVWVGDPGISESKFTRYFKKRRIEQDGFILHPVFIPFSVRDKFYNGFSNDTIWPLFHYFPSYAKFDEEYYENYMMANQIFAEIINEIYEPGDLIWIHDYHLMLLPSMLRGKLPDASVGFFLHIPFPTFELFRLLPNKWRTEILQGLLGSDLIGFHTNTYVQYFLQSVNQILGYDNSLRTIHTPDRSVTVDTFPISIDFERFHEASIQNEIFAERNKIKKRLNNCKLIISIDRLDYTKGLISRLEGFATFLDRYPEFIGKVVYILVVVPSRDTIKKYNEIKNEIEILISQINGKYGSIEWTPILYQYKSLDFKRLTGLYLAADAALVTPLRDGMNLVAKEFVASRIDRKGVLILSETAGASAELSEALLVNPADRNEIADTIMGALSMPPEEQVRRNTAMQNRLKQYDVVKWAEDFISQVEQSKKKQELLRINEVNKNIESELLEKFLASSKRLIFLDYDGTLSPIARLPHLAFPTDDLKELLKMLAADSNNRIILISGRPKEILGNWFENVSIELVAEHGAFYKLAGKGWQQMVETNTEWKGAVLSTLELISNRCPGSLIEQKELSLSWHYRNSDGDLGFLRSRELLSSLSELSSHFDFQILDGNKVIEIKAHGVDKGSAAKRILNHSFHDFVIAIGDDKTDEDLFAIIPDNGYSIRVGLTQSKAKFNFRKQEDVIKFLRNLIIPTLV